MPAYDSISETIKMEQEVSNIARHLEERRGLITNDIHFDKYAEEDIGYQPPTLDPSKQKKKKKNNGNKKR